MDINRRKICRLLKANEAVKKLKDERIQTYNLHPNRCATCEIALDYKRRTNKFCSQSCAAKKNNLGKNRHGTSTTNLCLTCGSKTRNPKFCTLDCMIEHRKERRLEKILETGTIKANASTTKKYLIKIRGHCCSICHEKEWNGQPIPLVLDHINGKPHDNQLINLRLVCGNCNMQLPTFAGRNVGNGGGRPYRMKRYYEGKIW